MEVTGSYAKLGAKDEGLAIKKYMSKFATRQN